MATLSVEERLGLPERLQMEVTCGFWTKESLEAFDGHAGDVLEYRGEQFRAIRVESWSGGLVETMLAKHWVIAIRNSPTSLG